MLEIRLFGRGRLVRGGAAFSFHAPKKAFALLAYLLLHAGQNWRRDVAFCLWPDISEEEALTNLRRHLLLLSATLPARTMWFEKSRSHIRWAGDGAAFVDVSAFESATPGQYAAVIDLYTGELLENLEEEWLAPHRNRLRDRAVTILAELCRSSWARGDFTGAVACARRRLRVEPWCEVALRELIGARIAGGDRGGAVEDYRQFRTRLEHELGVEPAPETVALYRSVVTAGDGTAPKPWSD